MLYSLKPAEVKPAKEEQQEKSDEDKEKEETEVKAFRAFTKSRIKEKKAGDIPLFEFKYVSEARAAELIRAATAEAVTAKLEAALNA